MNPDNDLNRQLERLLRSAAAANPSTVATALPYAVEARVLAAWRRRGTAGSDLASALRLLRYGLGIACGVALVAVSVTWHGTQQESDDISAISNATDNIALLR
jgi:hypothetical protein